MNFRNKSQKEDEYSLLNLNLINESWKKKVSLLIKLILLIAGREYSNDIKLVFTIYIYRIINICTWALVYPELFAIINFYALY